MDKKEKQEQAGNEPVDDPGGPVDDPGGPVDDPGGPEDEGTGQPGAGKAGEVNLKKGKQGSNLIESLRKLKAYYKELLLILIPAVAGLVTLYKWFWEWWFGLGFAEWHLLVLLGIFLSLLLLFLVFICCLSSYPKMVRYSAGLLIVGVVLFFLGVIVTYGAYRLRSSAKTVILVNAFEGFEKRDYKFADMLRSRLEQAVKECSLEKCVKVISVKEPIHTDSGKRFTAMGLGRKHRAHIVISGWYGKEKPRAAVYLEFLVINWPKELSLTFRGLKPVTSEAFTVRVKDIETYRVQYYLTNKAEYQSILVLGLTLYGNREWDAAKSCFDDINDVLPRLENFKKLQQGNKDFELTQKDLLKDRALVQLLSGNCCLNVRKFDDAIEKYNSAIATCDWRIAADPNAVPNEMYKILARAYESRAIAYREKNAFDAAAADLKKAGSYEPQYHVKKERIESYELAKKLYVRSDAYIEDSKLVHAQAELVASIRILRELSSDPPLPEFGNKYRLELVQSLLKLGRIHNNQAPIGLPEHDVHTKKAVESLEEAIKTISKIGDTVDDFEVKKLHAYCLRERGIVYFAQGKYDKANEKHLDAKRIFETLEDVAKDPNGRTECRVQVAVQYIHIGDVHRWRGRTERKEDEFEVAIEKYRDAVAKVGGEEWHIYLKEMKSDLKIPDPCEAMTDNEVHHLANVLAHLGEALLERARPGDEPNNNSVEEGVKLLERATAYYCRLFAEEWNPDLRDDYAWCQTIYGHGLVKQGGDFGKAERELKNALKLHEGLLRRPVVTDKEKDNFAWNLFVLAAAQYGQVKKQPEAKKRAQDTLLRACRMLKTMTAERKKIWFSYYLDEIFPTVSGFISKKDKVIGGHLGKVKEWLGPEAARDGKSALNEIIKELEKRGKQSK